MKYNAGGIHMREEGAKLTEEERAQINALSIGEMHDMWKFAPDGAFISGDPWSAYFQQSMAFKRNENPGAWVAASKASSRR